MTTVTIPIVNEAQCATGCSAPAFIVIDDAPLCEVCIVRMLLPNRFTERVDYTNSCWLWLGAHDGKGYGHMSFDGNVRRTHRLVYERIHGAIPPGMVVMHACDTPACVRPSHLSIGTDAENTVDSTRKGRRARQRGELSGQAKLTNAQRALLRAEWDAIPRSAKGYPTRGLVTKLAAKWVERHGLTRNGVKEICSKRSRCR
ncbi:MAG: HNH endonuclease [Planctomycetota bacterium]